MCRARDARKSAPRRRGRPTAAGSPAEVRPSRSVALKDDRKQSASGQQKQRVDQRTTAVPQLDQVAVAVVRRAAAVDDVSAGRVGSERNIDEAFAVRVQMNADHVSTCKNLTCSSCSSTRSSKYYTNSLDNRSVSFYKEN